MSTTTGPTVSSVVKVVDGGTGVADANELASAMNTYGVQNVTKWRAIMGKIANGLSSGKIMCVGDSTTDGALGNTTGTSYEQFSYPAFLANLFRGVGIQSDDNNIWNVGKSIGGVDDRFTAGGNWTASAFAGSGVKLAQASTSSSALTYTPRVPVDTFVVYYAISPGAGTFSIDINGSGSVSQSQNGAASYSSRTITSALALNTLNINQVSGTVSILAILAFDSSKNRISVINAGVGGSTAASWGISTSAGFGAIATLGSLGQNLTIIQLGINDWGAGESLSTYQTGMQNIITAAKTQGDVIIASPVPSSPSGSGVSQATQLTYIAVLRALAISNSCLFVDVFNRWGSYGAVNPAGFYSNADGTGIHPSGIGYFDVAQAFFTALNQFGASLSPTPVVSLLPLTRMNPNNVTATTTTLADIQGMTVNVAAAGTYQFKANLYVSPDATGGHKYAIAGTATATNIVYQINSFDNSANTNVINSRQTALAGSAGQAGATVAYTTIEGTIIVNAAGTLTAQFAQNTASGISTLLKGSSFIVQRM